MSCGMGLLAKFIGSEQPISFFSENNVAKDCFEKEEIAVFDFLQEYGQKYGTVPKMETVERECSVKFGVYPDEPVGYWLDTVEKRKQISLMASMIGEVSSSLTGGNVEGARQQLRELVVTLDERDPVASLQAIADLGDGVLAQHDQRQHEGIMSGIPFGFPYIDNISDGAQGSDTVALVGRPGCTAGDTRIYYSRKAKGSGRYYTIKEAYYKFNNISRDGIGKGKALSGKQYMWDKDTPTFTQSLRGEIIGHNEVLYILYSGRKQLYRISTESGKSIRVTAEHPFKVPKGCAAADVEGFKQLQNLSVGDYVICKAPNKIEAERIVSIVLDEVEDTYDMVLKQPYPNYVADGFVVHNTGKTFVLLKWALAAHAAGHTPLFMTMEMSPLQCARRALAMKSSIPATLIRLGRLSVWARNQLITNLNEFKDLNAERPFHFLQGSLKTTVDDLVLRVQELRPSALYVDGAYLLRTSSRFDGRFERVAETAETLKTIAREFDIPVLASYQFNRKGAGNLANIALSDSIGQLASIVIGIQEDEGQSYNGWEAVSFKLLALLKGREGEQGVIRILYDMNRMNIAQHSVVSGIDEAPNREEQETDR